MSALGFQKAIARLLERGHFLLLLAGLVFSIVAAHGNDPISPSPDSGIKTMVSTVLSALESDITLTKNRKRMLNLVENFVAPQFDFREMTRLTAGKYWPQATTEQRQALTNEYRTLLIHTIARALSHYSGERVTYPSPARVSDHEAEVDTLVVATDGSTFKMVFFLWETPHGWKIRDVRIDDISLMETYRLNFYVEAEIGGINHLMKTLAEKNRENDLP